MPYPKNVVISAAGIGSRLGLNMPKCLVKILNKRIIEYQLELLKDVDNIFIVTGFREEKVIPVVKSLRPDAIIARNPDYSKTSTLQSIHKVARYLDESFIIIDGDVIFEPDSFKAFLENCKDSEALIGVTKAKTEDAVFVCTNTNGEITGFQRSPKTSLEWTGLACIPSLYIEDKNEFVFKVFEPFLPLPYQEVTCLEIDTQQDLDLATHTLANNWKADT